MKDKECADHWNLTRKNDKEIALIKSDMQNMEEKLETKIETIVNPIVKAFEDMRTRKRDIKKGLAFPVLIVIINLGLAALIKWG